MLVIQSLLSAYLHSPANCSPSNGSKNARTARINDLLGCKVYAMDQNCWLALCELGNNKLNLHLSSISGAGPARQSAQLLHDFCADFRQP